MITYKACKVEELVALAEALIAHNLSETVSDFGALSPEVDVLYYQQLEEWELCKLYAAYEEDKIVGYSVFIISNASHYDNTKTAHNDVLFVAPPLRSSGIAKGLMDFAEKDLKEQGIQIIYLSLKKESSLPLELGYALEEYKYSKYIGKENE
jgi:GNAT superfamily N-acetyltransferase